MAGVLQIVPVAKSLSCCLIVPMASYMALKLERKAFRQETPIKASHALTLGLFTGVFAAFFATALDALITYVTKTNDIIAALPEIQKMIRDFPQGWVAGQTYSMIETMASEIMRYGFSPAYLLVMTLNNLLVDLIFGALGGLFAMQFINSKDFKKTN